MPYRVENIVRKGEIACEKQFLLFSQCFPQLYIFSASKCGIMWKWVKKNDKICHVRFVRCETFADYKFGLDDSSSFWVEDAISFYRTTKFGTFPVEDGKSKARAIADDKI